MGINEIVDKGILLISKVRNKQGKIVNFEDIGQVQGIYECLLKSDFERGIRKRYLLDSSENSRKVIYGPKIQYEFVEAEEGKKVIVDSSEYIFKLVTEHLD